MKKVLILGGTQFIGRNLVEQLQGLNYDITLFNRQQTQPNLFPDVKKIKGDRETADIKYFTDQYWDCIIDFSCFYPDSLEILLNKLKGKAGRYIFISTLSVYGLDEDLCRLEIKENFETLPCNQFERRDNSMTTYGQRKAECERVLLKKEWLDKIILRPSIVYGKYDPTDRFYYWLYKAKKCKRVVLPNNGMDKITLSYVEDLTNIIIQSIKIKNHSTIYNATTHQPLSLREIIQYINRDIYMIDINPHKLISIGLNPGQDIPLWFNSPLMVSNERLSKDFQLVFKSFNDSIEETALFFANLNWPIPKTGLNEIKENDLIEKCS